MPTSTLGQRVEHAHLAFALAMQRALPGGSVTGCWSPYSVASALGLVAVGARGSTRDELAALLVGDPHGQLAEHGAMLAEAVDLGTPATPGTGDFPVLRVANTLWARGNLPIRAEFASELRRWPGGAVRPAPFATDLAGARRLINADVANTTNGLIPELIGQGVLKPNTLATLVNALYLKVAWQHRFPAAGTVPRAFHGPAGNQDVPTMSLDKRLGYAATDGWQVVVVPAAGGVDAVVLLPDADLATAEAGLTADRLAALLAAPSSAHLRLFLPRFRVTAKADLGTVLRGLGVHTVFSDQADLSGISPEPMAVSAVLHEAVLTIDEEGLEGAAATALVFRMASMVRAPDEPIEVRVDRPFLFLVRHRASGAVYFLARVVAP